MSKNTHQVVSITKDGIWVIVSQPTTKYKADKFKKETTPVKGEKLAVKTVNQVKKHKNVLGEEYVGNWAIYVRKSPDAYWEELHDNLSESQANKKAIELVRSGTYHEVKAEIALPFEDGGAVGINFQDDFKEDRYGIEERVQEQVADMVLQGYISGELYGEEPDYSGEWSVDVEDSEENSEIVLAEVSRLIREGYTQGYDPSWSYSATVWSNMKKGGKVKRSKKAIETDKSIKALHAGKRESADGNIYYEHRENRSDKDRRKKLAKGGKSDSFSDKTTYVPNRDVKSISVQLHGELKKFKGQDIYDGVYLKDKAVAKKEKVAEGLAEELYNEIKNSAAEILDVDYDLGINEKVKLQDIKNLLEAGYTAKQVKYIYLGILNMEPSNADVSYRHDGVLLFYEADYIPEKLEKLISAAKNNQFSLGLKYPTFNWSKIIEKYKIAKKPILFTSDVKLSGNKSKTYHYQVFVGENIAIGNLYKIDNYENNKLSYSNDTFEVIKDATKLVEYQKERDYPAGFNGSYWGVISSKSSVIDDVAKKLLNQQSGYVKDFDLYVDELSALKAKDLDKEKISYETGGEITWQNVEVGDSAIVKEKNKIGLIIKTYGRKFHLQFPDETQKTFDASELKFIKDKEIFNYETGGGINQNWSTNPNGTTYNLEDGGKINHDKLYQEWSELINMSAKELQAFLKTPEGKEAGLSKSEAKEQGISSGQESAKWVIKMKKTPKKDWTPQMWEWAQKQINFVKRMSGVKGDLKDKSGKNTPKHNALLLWGHNPLKTKTMKKAKGGKASDKWMQEATQEMEEEGTEGLFTKKAKKRKLSTVAFAKKVLKNPKYYDEKTRKEAQFMKNANPEKFEDGGSVTPLEADVIETEHLEKGGYVNNGEINTADIPLLEKGGKVNEDNFKRFDVDFYKSINDRQTSEEKLLRSDNFKEIISKSTEIAKKNDYDYIEIYYKDNYIGSLYKKNDYAFKNGKDWQQNPLKGNYQKDYKYAKGGTVGLDTVEETKNHYGLEDEDWDKLSEDDKIDLRRESYKDLMTGRAIRKKREEEKATQIFTGYLSFLNW